MRKFFFLKALVVISDRMPRCGVAITADHHDSDPVLGHLRDELEEGDQALS